MGHPVRSHATTSRRLETVEQREVRLEGLRTHAFNVIQLETVEPLLRICYCFTFISSICCIVFLFVVRKRQRFRLSIRVGMYFQVTFSTIYQTTLVGL